MTERVSMETVACGRWTPSDGRFVPVRLTAEGDAATIKRYEHVKPARFWWSRRCRVRLAGTSRSCTRESAHKGPHVAHGAFGRPLAVWDEGDAIPRREREVAAKPARMRRVSQREGPLEVLRAFAGRVARRPHHFMEQAFLLVLVVAMVGFVIDWALRIIGAR
jgi:hypothetical protein